MKRITITLLIALFACMLNIAQSQEVPPEAEAPLDDMKTQVVELYKRIYEEETKRNEVTEAAARNRTLDNMELTREVRQLEDQVMALEGDGVRKDSAEAAYLLLQNNMDVVWMLTAAFLVFLMQAGFCMVEMGFTRAKNSINIVMKNVLDFAIASSAYLLIGFAIMFGASKGGWIGLDALWLSKYSGDSKLWAFWAFQVMFAAAASTIASGAMAERTRFLGYVCYTFLLTAIIYPVFGHWVWGSAAGGLEPGFGGSPGWLEAMGFHDFAGSTVVHVVGGAAALAGIIVIGPRVGKFAEDGTPRLIPGHNMPLAALGTFLLWFGWFGFNAGSTFVAGVEIGRIVTNTLVSGSFGVIFSMGVFWWLQGRPDASLTLNGALAGLVAITACCDCVTPASATIIGSSAGVIAALGTLFLERIRLDDVVGAVPVHLLCGVWGTLCVALFNENASLFTPEWFAILGVQALGASLMAVGAFVCAFGIFKVVDLLVGLRATDEEQIDGLDFSEHSANAYPDFQTISN